MASRKPAKPRECFPIWVGTVNSAKRRRGDRGHIQSVVVKRLCQFRDAAIKLLRSANLCKCLIPMTFGPSSCSAGISAAKITCQRFDFYQGVCITPSSEIVTLIANEETLRKNKFASQMLTNRNSRFERKGTIRDILRQDRSCCEKLSRRRRGVTRRGNVQQAAASALW